MKIYLAGLVIILAAILPSLCFASEERQFGTVGAIQFGSSVSSNPISVSFTGTDSDVFRREFMKFAESQNQGVNVPVWGGKYQVYLAGERKSAGVYGSLWQELGKRTHINANVNDWVGWQLTADVKQKEQFLFSESASASGPQVNVNLSSWGNSTGFSGGAYHSWLNDSLRGKAIRELVPKIMARLQALEQPQERSESRMIDSPATKASYKYTLVIWNSPVPASFPQELTYGSKVAVIKNGHRIGELTVSCFDSTGQKVFMVGDEVAASKPGCKFVLQ